MSLKPITLFSHNGGPNPWKVAILLEELGLPYTTIFKEFGDGENGVKNASFLKINPNGRVPAITDPNNGDLNVWESGAILLYLQKKYDTHKKLAPKDEKEEAEIWSWLSFQISGLGPSQGQANWFIHYHAEKGIKSAIERYQNETRRCYGVVESRLATSGLYLVGNKLTIADISFYPWIKGSEYMGLKLEEEIKEKYPHLYKWFKNLDSLDSVKKAYAKKP